MNLTSPTVDVVEGVHQAVVLKFGVLQMGSEMGLTVRNQTGQAGFQGLAGAVHARVTQHIMWNQSARCLSGRFLRFLPHAGTVLNLLQILLTVIAESCHISKCLVTLNLNLADL